MWFSTRSFILYFGVSQLAFHQLVHFTRCQYPEGTPNYEQKHEINENMLRENFQIHPSTQPKSHAHHPDDDLEIFGNKLGYRIAIPHPQDYVISLIVNPCGVNLTSSMKTLSPRRKKRQWSWEPVPLMCDCCMHVFGRGEYGYLTKEAIQQQHPYPYYRIGRSDVPILAQPNEVFHNIHLVDEHGVSIPFSESRRADDSTVIDENCLGLRDPYPACLQNRLRAVKSTLMPPCMDYNQTVDSTLDCRSPNGDKHNNCMQVGFGQTAFIHVCNEEIQKEHKIAFQHCGTFLEIHLPNGSRYDSEETVLSETKLTTHITNGMVTTILSLLYKNDPHRLLCDYRETTLRIGSMVVINDQAPRCCCPRMYTKGSQLGSFLCPKKPKTKRGGGPFADAVDTIAELVERDAHSVKYPHCPFVSEDEDMLMCSRQSTIMEDRYDKDVGITRTQGRFYSYPCEPVVHDESTNTFTSSDLEGSYGRSGKCPHGDAFQSCVHLNSPGDTCIGQDYLYSFAGEMGKIVSMPIDVSDTSAEYGITFNDGRTVYYFYRHQLDPLYEDNVNINSYEIWFVQRTSRERIVQKKKPFRVVYPRCTFDSTNGVYFPFAQLNQNGEWMETFSEYDGAVEERDYVLDSLKT